MNKNNTNAVPLNTTTFNTRLLNTTKLNTNGFPVLSKRSGSSADISQAIMDSLVCWYDIGKQQCTNESMAANPVLADLSGNGHDITCYNFAWAGMSGIGGTEAPFTNRTNVCDSCVSSKGGLRLVLNGLYKGNDVTFGSDEVITDKLINPVQITVSNIPDIEGFDIIWEYRVKLSDDTYIDSKQLITANGIYNIDLPELDLENKEIKQVQVYRFYCSKIQDNVNFVDFTIEQLPLYPNALVSDGVDDYCYTDGLPILTDYTVIAKRSYQGFDNSVVNAALATKRDSTSAENGAFQFERNLMKAFSFGSTNSVDVNLDTAIAVQTTDSYDGYKINRGDLIDTNYLSFFNLRTNTFYQNLKAALYSFLLFDSTLTTAEIEWVKKNMIESGGVLATNWSDSSLWAFYNLSNQSRIDGTISNNRMVIAANGERTDVSVTAKFMECIVQNSIVPAYKIKVTGLKNGIILYYADNQAYNPIRLEMSEDGIYNIPEHNTQNRYFGFSFNKAFENENIVIQQLLSE